MTMGCIPSYVVESMCRYQQGSTHMPCSCQMPCIKALWCGQTHAILSYLESPILHFLLSIFLVQHQVMELCHDSSHLCIRHCVLAPSIYHHVKHQFCCWCISMPYLSLPWCNKGLWHYDHGLLSYFTQGITPLCHCWEMRLSCLMSLWQWVAHHHISWNTCVGANKAHPLCPSHVKGLAPRPLNV